jgi:hypothetical protein
MTRQRERSATMSAAGSVAAIGLVFIVRGVALAWRPGGWILGGIFIAVPSVLVAYAAFREK